MISDIKVELTIKDNSKNLYLSIPVLPPTVAYTEGARKTTNVEIINLGDVEYLNGVALDSMSWTSFFPKRYDPGYCNFKGIKDPLAYKEQFKSWKNAGTSLQVICPAAGINTNMYVVNFSWELKGAEGDIYYSVELRQRKQIRPIQIATSQALNKGKNTALTARPAAATPTKPKTYTVVSGDNLTLIAKKLSISNWRTIFEANKDKIKDPDKIFAGQVLKVP